MKNRRKSLGELSERHWCLVMPEDWERFLWPEMYAEIVDRGYRVDFGVPNVEGALKNGDDEARAA